MMGSLLFGIQYVLRHWKMTALIFGIQLCGAGVVGMLFQKDLSTHLGHSISGKLLTDGFNYSVFKDLMRTVPDAFSGVTSGFMIVFVLFMFLAVFLHGGAIKSLIDNDANTRSLLRNGKRFFLPFLGVAVLSLVLLLIITALLWAPLAINFISLNERLESDRLFFYIVYAVLILYLCLVGFIVSWSINTRINYAVMQESLWSSITAGWSWTRKKTFPLLLFFFFFLGIGFLFMFLNVKLDQINSIWVAFLGALFILFCRVVSRLWYYGALARYASAIEGA